MVNVGTIDRVVRAVAGAGLLAAPFIPALNGTFAGMGDWKYLVAGVGVVLLATAALKICPAYSLFGIRTCEIAKR